MVPFNRVTLLDAQSDEKIGFRSKLRVKWERKRIKRKMCVRVRKSKSIKLSTTTTCTWWLFTMYCIYRLLLLVSIRNQCFVWLFVARKIAEHVRKWPSNETNGTSFWLGYKVRAPTCMLLLCTVIVRELNAHFVVLVSDIDFLPLALGVKR